MIAVLQLVLADRFGVLGGNDDGVDANRLARFVVFHGDLRLAVRQDVGQDMHLAHIGQTLGQRVRQLDRQGHEVFGLAAGVAEHHALIARARVLFDLAGNAHVDIRALLVQIDGDRAGVRVKAVTRLGVADFADGVAGNLLVIHLCGGGDFAEDVHRVGDGGDLAGDVAHRVLRKQRVENRVGDLVADLIGMPLGDALGGKQRMHRQSFFPQPAPQVEQSWLQAQRRSAVGCQFLAYSSHLAHR